MITIDHNARQGASAFGRVATRVIRQTENAAKVQTLRQVRTRMSRDVRANTGIPAKILRKRFIIARRNPKEFMFVGTFPVPAIKLNARELKKGVSYKGPSGRIRQRDAFIRKGNNNNVHVFRRVGRARLPIQVQEVSIHEPALRSARRLMVGFAPAKFREIYEREFEFRYAREVSRNLQI